MNIENLYCITCKKPIVGVATIFKCPNCGQKIMRCQECKKNGKTWTCEKCGFKGP